MIIGSQQIKLWASDEGFDACGVARCRALDGDGLRLRRWLDAGFSAGMEYMSKNVEKRVDPQLLVEGARSVVVTLAGYNMPAAECAQGVASYAHDVDYHYFLKERLERLLDKIKEYSPETQGRVFVDSAPVFERRWAVEAGLGWIGRNTMLINRELGSFTFIGVIITDAEFDAYDAPFEDEFCRGCHACISACPSGAITCEGVDARCCISYHTIENRDAIPAEVEAVRGGRIFGCDECQRVCPHNARAPIYEKFSAEISQCVATLDRQKIETMTGGEFCRLFGSTPLMRSGLKKIKRTLGFDVGK